MGKPTIYIGENKGVDQLRSTFEADQRLCFLYTDSTVPLLSKSKISSLQPGLCPTWSDPKLLVFSRTSSYFRVKNPILLKIVHVFSLSVNHCFKVPKE